MNASKMKAALALAAMTASNMALAAGGDLGQVDKQPTNWVAISMFAVFVLATLWITKWAAARTRSATTETVFRSASGRMATNSSPP